MPRTRHSAVVLLDCNIYYVRSVALARYRPAPANTAPRCYRLTRCTLRRAHLQRHPVFCCRHYTHGARTTTPRCAAALPRRHAAHGPPPPFLPTHTCPRPPRRRCSAARRLGVTCLTGATYAHTPLYTRTRCRITAARTMPAYAPAPAAIRAALLRTLTRTTTRTHHLRRAPAFCRTHTPRAHCPAPRCTHAHPCTRACRTCQDDGACAAASCLPFRARPTWKDIGYIAYTTPSYAHTGGFASCTFRCPVTTVTRRYTRGYTVVRVPN